MSAKLYTSLHYKSPNNFSGKSDTQLQKILPERSACEYSDEYRNLFKDCTVVELFGAAKHIMDAIFLDVNALISHNL